MRLRSRSFRFALLALTSCCMLTGCLLDEEKAQPETYSGVVADGPLQGATVFLDKDGDFNRDDDEPATITDAQGQYRREVWGLTAQQRASLSVVAEVPASAIDADTGQAVGAPYLLSAPAREHGFISPLSTLSHLVGLLYPQLPSEARREMVSDFLDTEQAGETAFSADALSRNYLLAEPGSGVQALNERLHAKARFVAVMLQRALAGPRGDNHGRLSAFASYAFAADWRQHRELWGMTTSNTPTLEQVSVTPDFMLALESALRAWRPITSVGLPAGGRLDAVTATNQNITGLQLTALSPCGPLQMKVVQREFGGTWQATPSAEEIWLARSTDGEWRPLYGSEFHLLSTPPGRSRCQYNADGVQLVIEYQAYECDLADQSIAQHRSDWIGSQARAGAIFSPQARALQLREARTRSNLAPGALMALPTQRAVPNLTVDELLRGCPTNTSRCGALFFDSAFEPGLLFGNITSTQQTPATGRISYKSFFFQRDCRWQQGADTRSEWLTLSDCRDSWMLGFFFRLPSSDGAAFLIEQPNTAAALIRVGSRQTRLPRARELWTTYYNAAALADLNAALPGGTDQPIPAAFLQH